MVALLLIVGVVVYLAGVVFVVYKSIALRVGIFDLEVLVCMTLYGVRW